MVRIVKYRGGGHVGSHGCHDQQALVEYQDGNRRWIACCTTKSYPGGAPICGGDTPEYRAAQAAHAVWAAQRKGLQ